MPVSRLHPRRLVGPLAELLDRAVTHAVARHHQVKNGLADDAELCERASRAAHYFASASPDNYIQAPRPIEPVVTRLDYAERADLRWASNHRVFCAEVGAEYASYRENQRAVARLCHGAVRRPVAILVHGYMGGSFTLEEHIWPLAWFHELGFDTALFTLPFHGLRARPDSITPAFPQSNILFNTEGFRQSVTDLRDLVQWLLERGHPAVGLMGMSLGGYVASLTATLEARLSFLVPIIPLACLADFAREQGRVPRGSARSLAYQKDLRYAYRWVSPLHRPPLIDPKRVLVVAGKADRITPPEHARALARHFGAPLEAFSGGHLLQFGRAKSLQRVKTLLLEAVRTPAQV